jgi:hypothetical protein
MRTSLRLFLLLAAAAGTLACDDTALEPVSAPDFAVSGAERRVEKEVYDLEGEILHFFCVVDGEDIVTEPILMRGQIVERFLLLELPSGGYHTQFRVSSMGLGGTGVESGAEYTVTDRYHGISNQSTMRDGGSYQVAFRVASKELGKSMNLVYRGHFSVNANGELVVERETAKEDCEL